MNKKFLVHLMATLFSAVLGFAIGSASGKAVGKIEGREQVLLTAQKCGAGHYEETKQGVVFIWTPERRK